MNKKINWGIIGLGKIAHKFASDLLLSNDATLYAVASREQEKATIFGKKYNASRFYSSYEELANDPQIDIIYIATPHTFHYENTMLCLQKGKNVLCEKPMGMNHQEVTRMIQEAKQRNLFLMEGIWTRFIPATEKLIDLLEKNTIGEITSIRSDFGFKGEIDKEKRIYNKKLGGGSLLDVGIYPIYISLLTLGIPIGIKAMARMTDTEVDAYCSILFDYKNGAKAILESSIDTKTPTEAYIYGKKGSLKLHSRFHNSEKITLDLEGGQIDLNLKYKGNGYIYEIEEVTNCLINKQTESTKLPLKTSNDLIELIDKVRKEIGLEYKTI